MDNITIDEMIAKLKEAKKAIGGDKSVSFWIKGNYQTYYPVSEEFKSPVNGKLAGDKSEVSFEIGHD